MTYQVTISVENRWTGEPVRRLGSTTLTVEAESAALAEAEAIRRISEKWAVGGKWVAQADEWEAA